MWKTLLGVLALRQSINHPENSMYFPMYCLLALTETQTCILISFKGISKIAKQRQLSYSH